MEKEKKVIKIIAVVGPTASGKSNLAIQLAKKFNGEIINADSRQIYKYMNIGTAKDPDDDLTDKDYTVDGIPVHLIDFLEPDKIFSVAEFQKLAYHKIFEIDSRGKIPFLMGGTGLWVDAVCKGYVFVEGEALDEVRKELSGKSVSELYNILEELNPDRANALNESDRKNPRRLIRAIEKELTETTPFIPHSGGKLSEEDFQTPSSSPLSGGEICIFLPDTCAESRNRRKFNFPPDTSAESCPELAEGRSRSKGGLRRVNCLYLSPQIDFPTLEKRIYARVDKMFEEGLLEENKKLIEMGYTYDLLAMSGIGYKEFEGYFKGEKTLDEVREEIKLRSRQYAKRQVTWFKRNKEIRYVDFEEAEELLKKHLSLFENIK